jgi:peptidoglycan hydrolase-like protein with peptidoglycan-binding domain
MWRRIAIVASFLTPMALVMVPGASAEELQLSAPVTGMGNWLFEGPVEVEDGRFRGFFKSGNARLEVSGRVDGDTIAIGGNIKVTGFFEQAEGFDVAGEFKDGVFVGKFTASLNYGSHLRGEFTITRPAAQAAAETKPDNDQAAVAQPPAMATQPVKKKVTEPPQQAAPAKPATPTPETLEPQLSRAQRQAVQQQLTVLGFYDRGVDGSFGPGTRLAIRRFQVANGLEPTGYLDPLALSTLKDAARTKEQQIAAEESARAAEEQGAAAADAAQAKQEADAAAKLLAEQQAAQAKAEAERKAADEQARLLAEQVKREKQALEAQKAELKRQQEELAKAQQQADAAKSATATAPETRSTATAPEETATETEPVQAAPAPPSDFASVIPTLQPIDEVFVAIKPAKIRSAPNVAATRVGTLNVGETIAVLGRLPNQDWYLVARDEQPIGYVVASQLAAQSDPTRTTPEPPPPADILETAAPPQEPALPPELAALDYGRYHALVIGNNNYRSLPKLATAIADAEGVATELERNYGFNVRLMTNASEEDIIGALTDMRRELEFGDNLLVYYAGHGWYDEDTEQGYWLPVDASEDNQSNWISNADITNGLKALKAKHIIVVADSCFSGTLARGAKPSLRGIDYVERIVKKKARTVLTSGGQEPVMDSGGGGHSVFARAFLTALEENDAVMDGQELFRRLRDSVVANAPQTPEYSDIRGAGHDGGDFLFVRR